MSIKLTETLFINLITTVILMTRYIVLKENKIIEIIKDGSHIGMGNLIIKRSRTMNGLKVLLNILVITQTFRISL